MALQLMRSGSSRLARARAGVTGISALCIPLLLAACTTLGSFEKLDANRDGGISPEEAQRSADLSSLFNTADDDQDGVLNPEEYALVREVISRDRTSSHRGPPKSSGGGHAH